MQGQSIENNLGVYVIQPLFFNRQLYFALLGAGLPHRTKVMSIDI